VIRTKVEPGMVNAGETSVLARPLITDGSRGIDGTKRTRETFRFVSI